MLPGFRGQPFGHRSRPEFKLHQCGLPRKMALKQCKPFIYHRREQTRHCTTIKQVKEWSKI